MKSTFAVFAVLPALALLPLPAPAQAGWQTKVVGKNVVMTPPDLADGQAYQITIYPRTPMAGASITGFADASADREAAARGKLSGKAGPALSKSPETAIAVRRFVTPDGPRLALYYALSPDGKNARIVSLVSSTDSALIQRHQPQMLAVVAEMKRQDKAHAAAPGKMGAQGEAERDPLVTPPGQGVQAAQIEGIFDHFALEFGGGAPKATSTPCLLLKDGTIHEGLSVPPDQLDVALSRQRELEKWGRWRREGTKIAAAWPDSPNQFKTLEGDMAIPARPGERLSGRFGTGESGGSPLASTYYRLWGVTFTPAGRFTKDEQGGASSGSLGKAVNDTSINTTTGDDGAVTSFNSPTVTGGVQTKKRGGARTGTYSVSGYVLTLRYDDGRVARLPFFFESAKHDLIYFEGATMNLGDGK